MKNKYFIDGDIANIDIGHGKFARVNVCDLDLISDYDWRLLKAPRNFYCIANKRVSKGRFVTVHMHRIITNAPKGMQVDHIDSDGLNNTGSNIRVVTVSQNQMNKKRHKDKFGLKGAYYHARDNRWLSSICVDYKIIYLGCFKTEIEAHEAYCEASKKYHCEYGRAE